MFRAACLFFTCGLLLNTAAAQLPEILYATDGEFGDSQPSRTSMLYILDAQTGAVLRTIGDVGEDIVALTVLPSTNELYGLTAGNSNNPGSIVLINTETAAATILGAVGPFNGVTLSIEDIHSSRINIPFSDDEFDAIWLAGIPVQENLGPVPLNSVHFFDVQSGQVRDAGLFLQGPVPLNRYGITERGRVAIAGCNLPGFDTQVLSLAVLSPTGIGIDPPLFPDNRSLLNSQCIIAADTNSNNQIVAVEQLALSDPGRRLVITGNDLGPNGSAVSVQVLGDLPDFTSALAFAAIPLAPVPGLQFYGLLVLIAVLIAAGLLFSHKRQTG